MLLDRPNPDQNNEYADSASVVSETLDQNYDDLVSFAISSDIDSDITPQVVEDTDASTSTDETPAVDESLASTYPTEEGLYYYTLELAEKDRSLQPKSNCQREPIWNIVYYNIFFITEEEERYLKSDPIIREVKIDKRLYPDIDTSTDLTRDAVYHLVLDRPIDTSNDYSDDYADITIQKGDPEILPYLQNSGYCRVDSDCSTGASGCSMYYTRNPYYDAHTYGRGCSPQICYDETLDCFTHKKPITSICQNNQCVPDEVMTNCLPIDEDELGSLSIASYFDAIFNFRGETFDQFSGQEAKYPEDWSEITSDEHSVTYQGQTTNRDVQLIFGIHEQELTEYRNLEPAEALVQWIKADIGLDINSGSISIPSSRTDKAAIFLHDIAAGYSGRTSRLYLWADNDYTEPRTVTLIDINDSFDPRLFDGLADLILKQNRGW